MTEREILFEFMQVGVTVRVAAIDAASGIEVIVVAPASTARADLKRLAIQKLERRLKTNNTPNR